MTCACGCGAPMTCSVESDRTRALLDVARQLVNTGAIAERDALRALTDAMTAFSDAARPASDAALAFNYAIQPLLPRPRAHDEPIEVTYEFRFLEGRGEEPAMGYNGRPLTDALRAAMPNMIDSMTGTTQSENIAPSEPLTLDALRAARARLLDGPVSDADERIFTRAARGMFLDAPPNDDHIIGHVQSVRADGTAVVRYHTGHMERPAPTPEPKKLPVRKIVTD